MLLMSRRWAAAASVVASVVALLCLGSSGGLSLYPRRLHPHEYPLANRFYRANGYGKGGSCKRSDVVLTLSRNTSTSTSTGIIAAVRLSRKAPITERSPSSSKTSFSSNEDDSAAADNSDDEDDDDDDDDDDGPPPLFLLRGLCVDIAERRRGYARKLLSAGVREFLDGEEKGTRCYCFPRRHLGALYRDAGFDIFDIGAAPLPPPLQQQQRQQRRRQQRRRQRREDDRKPQLEDAAGTLNRRGAAAAAAAAAAAPTTTTTTTAALFPGWLPTFAREEYGLVSKQNGGDVLLAVRTTTTAAERAASAKYHSSSCPYSSKEMEDHSSSAETTTTTTTTTTTRRRSSSTPALPPIPVDALSSIDDSEFLLASAVAAAIFTAVARTGDPRLYAAFFFLLSLSGRWRGRR